MTLDNQPDWGRNQVNTATQVAPVGASTMWGAQLTVPVIADNVARRYESTQIITAACKDSYSRPWSLVGSLRYPPGMSGMLDCLGSPAPGPDEWCAVLIVSMGVGQVQVVHNINLRATIAAQAPFYATEAQTLFTASVLPASVVDSVPFVIGADALVGNVLMARLMLAARLTSPPLPASVQIGISLAVTPFAAGTGL